jgi:Protein of unknown function (DUF2786)
MSDGTLSKISDRIRKLLALAGSTTSPNEATTAATAAQQLMQEYKLTEVDVSNATSDKSLITELKMGAEGFKASWKFALISKVAQAFFCEALGLRVGSRREVRLIGKKNDIEVALEVYGYLLKEIERLASRANPPKISVADLIREELWSDLSEGVRLSWETLPRENTDDVRSYREKFRMGAAMGAAAKLRAANEKFSKSNEKALAIVNSSKRLIKEHLCDKYGASRIVESTMSMRGDAFTDGYLAGSQIASLKKGEPRSLETK